MFTALGQVRTASGQVRTASGQVLTPHPRAIFDVVSVAVALGIVFRVVFQWRSSACDFASHASAGDEKEEHWGEAVV